MTPLRYLAVSLLVATAACGDSDDPPVTTPGTTPVAITTTAPTTTSTVAPAEASVSEIRFGADDVELAGDLRLPAGNGPHPAVVVMHGSGPVGRDGSLPGQLNMGFGFDLPVYAQIADWLQDSGYAVLTYDKRSCGPFNGCAENGYPPPDDVITVDTFIADAEAAVAALRQRADIDDDRIVLAGHSQGATFVPVMLAADPRIAAGVMIAGNHSPIDEIIAAQLERTLELLADSGINRDQAMEIPGVAEVDTELAALAELRAGNTDVVLSGGATAEFWLSWFSLADRAIAAIPTIEQPVYILNGGYDWNVPPDEGLAWKTDFDLAGRDAELATPDCITHALNCITQPDPARIQASDIGRTVSADVLTAIVDFLAANV